MNVKAIMTENPICVTAKDTLRVALEKMNKRPCKHLPVLSDSKHLIGVISDRDCRYALNSPHVLREREDDIHLLNTLEVRTVMTPAPIIIEPDIDASEAARLLYTHRIGCLPVMRAETLIGIITRSDMLLAFMQVHEYYERRMRLS